MTFDGVVCVYCSPRCTVCYELAYNCTACKSTGTNASFLWPANFSCEANCPGNMYANFTDRTCYDCDIACLSCRTLPTYCFECDVDAGYAWNGYTCYNPCPDGTFLTNNNSNCTNCSRFCQTCAVTSTNCSVCTLTGPNMAYLYNGSTCLDKCPN